MDLLKHGSGRQRRACGAAYTRTVMGPMMEEMRVRILPDGDSFVVKILSNDGRTAGFESEVPFSLDQPVELSGESVVYLGVVVQTEMQPSGKTMVWLELEHRLERDGLAEVQASWTPGEPPVGSR